jgi:divalent metal cation (Fe/Co/Zn/Cd) transporter
VLKVCAGFALFLMVVGLAFGGLIGIELLNVMQMAYFLVSLLTNVPATMIPFAQLSELVNGFVYRSEEAIYTYSQLLQMNVSAQFLSNCNIMLLVELIVMAVGFSLWLLSKGASDENKRSLLNLISMFLMKDILLLLALFNALNLSFSCGVYLRGVQSSNQSMGATAFNWLEIAFGLIIEIVILYCVFKGFEYTYCETVLKDKTA